MTRSNVDFISALESDDPTQVIIVPCKTQNGVSTLFPAVTHEPTEDKDMHYQSAVRQAVRAGMTVSNHPACISLEDAQENGWGQAFMHLLNPADSSFSLCVHAVYRDDEAEGEIDPEEDPRPLSQLIDEEFMLWSLYDALEMGEPINGNSGHDMVLYGYYNKITNEVNWM